MTLKKFNQSPGTFVLLTNKTELHPPPALPVCICADECVDDERGADEVAAPLSSAPLN